MNSFRPHFPGGLLARPEFIQVLVFAVGVHGIEEPVVAVSHELTFARQPLHRLPFEDALWAVKDRKSTRLNSSHTVISYAVFCLKKEKNTTELQTHRDIVFQLNLNITLQQLNGLETQVIIMVANKYAFFQITRRRFLNEWEAFNQVISRRNIRRRITIPLTLSNLKLLRRITRTENIPHRNFTRRQVVIQNRVASNIGISQSTFSVKVLNLFSRSRRKTNKRKSKHSAMLRNKETRHRMFIGLLNTTRKLA